MSRSGVSVRGVLRGLLAVAALGWAAFGLFWALLIVLPAPGVILGFFARPLIEGYSLLLGVYAVLGLGLAALTRWVGARRISLVTAIFAGATVVLCLIPTVQGWRMASEEGVALSLSEYFSPPSFIADGTPETVTYARPGEEELKLDVWQPPGGDGETEAGQRPAVVVVHGGGFNTGSRVDDPRWSQWYARNGYVVFDIDYRLAPPPRWQDATGDVKCAVGWARQNADRYGVDPDRIALVGSSAGGNLALMAAYTENDETFPPTCDVEDTGVSAVATFYAPTALTPYWESEFSSLGSPDDDDGSEPSGGLELFLDGDPGSVPDRYRIASPTSHADSGDPPTLLIHGGGDQFVPPEQARLLEAKLQEAGVSHSYVELPGANHAFDYAWGGWDTQVARARLEEFLEQHLARSDPGAE